MGPQSAGQRDRHPEDPAPRGECPRVQQRDHRLQRDLSHSLRPAQPLLPSDDRHASHDGRRCAGDHPHRPDEVRAHAVPPAQGHRPGQRRQGGAEAGGGQGAHEGGQEGGGQQGHQEAGRYCADSFSHLAFYGDEEESYSYSESEPEETKEETKETPKEETKETSNETPSETLDETPRSKVDPDLIRLLQAATGELESINSSVVLAAASLLLHLAPEGTSFVTQSVEALVHLLNQNDRYSFFVLDAIDELSALYPDYFLPWIQVLVLSLSHLVVLPAHLGAGIHHHPEDSHSVQTHQRGVGELGALCAAAVCCASIERRGGQSDPGDVVVCASF